MNLVRVNPWNPTVGLQALQREMSRMFGEAWPATSRESDFNVWGPHVDIYETDSHIVLEAELPGFSNDQVDISFENGQLTFSGERKFEEGSNQYHRVERWYGRFHRTFQLPVAVDGDQIKAELRQGVLTVTIPKAVEARRKQIAVSVSS